MTHRAKIIKIGSPPKRFQTEPYTLLYIIKVRVKFHVEEVDVMVIQSPICMPLSLPVSHELID